MEQLPYESLFQLVNLLPNLAWMAHGDGYIYWYNAQWYLYTGTSPEDMEGWGWQSVHDPKTLPAVMEQWKASIETGHAFEMTFPLRGADGVFRPFLTRVIPVKDGEKVVQWFGTNTDVTQEYLDAETLRMASMGRLASRIAHETNNPLEAILNLVYIMKGTELTAEQASLCVTMEEQLTRVAELMRTILTSQEYVKQAEAGTSWHAKIAGAQGEATVRRTR